MAEAVELCECRTGKRMDLAYSDQNRIGDHIWYISDTRKFQSHYPDWQQTYDLPRIVDEIYRIDVGAERYGVDLTSEG